MPKWFMDASGWDVEFGIMVLRTLWVLVIGLMLVRGLRWLAERFLAKWIAQRPNASRIINSIYILLVIQAVILAVHQLGFEMRVLGRVALALALVAISLYVILKPLFPSMPFKKGNTVEAAGLLGKVEGITLLYTRLRTFDGKTIFVPNSKILKENLVNYHVTPNRRINIDVGINYEDDLNRAKELLLELMSADERVLEKPAPKVYVLEFGDSCLKIGGRCWVPNLKYWKTRSDLLERVKLAFDQEENVSIAYPQREVRIKNG